MSLAWRPINTAPRDGTIVFVTSVETFPAAARWQSAEAAGIAYWRTLPGGGAWCTPDLRAVLTGPEPTMWMPIPDWRPVISGREEKTS